MLEDKVRALASGKNFCVLTTLMEDGTPQSHVMWVDHDGEHLLINTEVHRHKFKNMAADPRVTVTIIDIESFYSYVEVRGKVVETVTGPAAREHIDRMSERYLGKPYDNPVKSERVIVKIAPVRQVVH